MAGETRVLILTAGFGDGHNTAARGLREALESSGVPVRVEVVDLLRYAYGLINSVARHTYHGVINHAPGVWGGVYWLLDRTARWAPASAALRRATQSLGELIQQSAPDCVVATYPAYASMIESLYPDRARRSFLFGVVVTDSITVNATWHAAPADVFCVPNEETGGVLREAGVDPGRIRAFGFPVSPRFDAAEPTENTWEYGRRLRVLQILNHGTRKAVKTVRRLLKLDDIHLTVVTGRNARLRARLETLSAERPEDLRVLGWTDRMPELMRESHLVISKAGGATLQEAIAAGRPVVVTQVVPGQEEGNAVLVESLGLGAVARRPKDVTRLVAGALNRRGFQYRGWRRQVERQRRPAAAARFARYLLERCHPDPTEATEVAHDRAAVRTVRGLSLALRRRPGQPGLLCDFHVHSRYSDGRLDVPEVVEFYGRRGFDVVCLTDHIADRNGLIGRWGERLGLTLGPREVEQYFEVLARERRRAWDRYGLLVLTGLEFNREGFTARNSTHLLGLDLRRPIDPSLPLPQLMESIRSQGGLVVAPHPCRMPALLAKNTLHLWHHRDQYAPRIDAWEIANRDHIFSAVGLQGLPFIAGSDFHRPAHIRSWKTLLFCEKEPEAIKACIRRNRGVALVYCDGRGSLDMAEATAMRGTRRHRSTPQLPHRTCRSLRG